MKHLSHTKFILPVLLLVACGGSKTPVQDIDQMRANAKKEADAGQQPTLQNQVPVAQPTPPPVVKIETRTEYVPKEVKVVQEVAAAPGKESINVVADKNSAYLRFYEGTASSAKFNLIVAIKDVQMKLTAKTLPEGASLVHVGGNTYEVRWTPKFGTIPYSKDEALTDIVLVPELVSAKTSALENTVRGITQEYTFGLTVKRTSEKPSAIEISGLAKQISEGDAVPFSVTVRIPGLDNSGTKPRVAWSADASPQAAGIAYREMDGVRYVTSDPSRAGAEYLGDFKWKFNLLFDAKNVPVEEQKGKDGNVVPNADTTFTRTVIDVVPGGFFSAPTSVVIKVAIKRTNRPAPAAAAPAPGPAPAPAAPAPKKPAAKPTQPKTPAKKA